REATKAKDQFLAVMSHELRTPINAIMGYSDLLDLGVKGGLNDDQRAMLSRVRETSRHLLGLINEVLDLAKIGAGRMDLVITELDVGAIMERAVQQILPLAESKGLGLSVEAPRLAAAPLMVFADETRLMQILVNLLSNAVKFTTEGGITAAYDRKDGEVLIRVTDSGPGIPPDQAERIFEEFYQVEGGLSRTSGGTGLGLSIARRFARLMGGDVSVDTDLGRGSTFTVSLPAAEADPAAEEGTSEPTILVLARDDHVVQRFGSELAGDIRLLGATEPAQFATLARRERPDLVAIDARAPDDAAWRALSALQSERATAAIPTLLFAHADDRGRPTTEALELGVMTVLPKPLSVEHAIQHIREGGDGGEISVLVADDDPDVRRILGEALTAAGCDVRTASSGGEVLDLARRMLPDVAIIDLVMPGMDGVEVIAMMRQEPALQAVRIVALLNSEMPADEMSRLSATARTLARSRRMRIVPTADILRRAALRNGTGRQ
ncbi:MAG TPA: ATP-binding protein, partial [Longimicrobiales bacterium]|nr:ATP-binding protein [Longimicrobiales bacterium]